MATATPAPSPRVPARAAVPAPGRRGTIAERVRRLFAGKPRAGSGLPARPVIRALVWGRRVSQAGFLFLFLYLLARTAFRGTFASAETRVRLPEPVEAFLLADPFVAAMTVLSTHTIYRGLAWSVGLLALTLV